MQSTDFGCRIPCFHFPKSQCSACKEASVLNIVVVGVFVLFLVGFFFGGGGACM